MLSDVEKLLRTTADELEKMLSSKTVMGEPITIGETTIVPLRSAGFWFGTGGGGGKGGDKTKGEGEGEAAGTGGAGGVRPVAVLIIDKSGVRIEPMKGSMAQMAEKLTEALPKVQEAFRSRKSAAPKEG
jgi:uncharacterized spore protein YtfJ